MDELPEWGIADPAAVPNTTEIAREVRFGGNGPTAWGGTPRCLVPLVRRPAVGIEIGFQFGYRLLEEAS